MRGEGKRKRETSYKGSLELRGIHISKNGSHVCFSCISARTQSQPGGAGVVKAPLKMPLGAHCITR